MNYTPGKKKNYCQISCNFLQQYDVDVAREFHKGGYSNNTGIIDYS